MCKSPVIKKMMMMISDDDDDNVSLYRHRFRGDTPTDQSPCKSRRRRGRKKCFIVPSFFGWDKIARSLVEQCPDLYLFTHTKHLQKAHLYTKRKKKKKTAAVLEVDTARDTDSQPWLEWVAGEMEDTYR